MNKTLLILCLFNWHSPKAQVSFTQLPNQPPANVYSVVTDPTNGDIYACTATTIIRSSNLGVTWTMVANSGMNFLNVLYFSPSGQLYACANHTNATPYYGIEKYDKVANTWSILVGSPQDVTSIAEDASGNIYAGTGTTGNINPNPINYGTGVYKFNGSTWSAINTGMANLTGYSVLPYIKDLKILGTGEIVAATYGNAVIKYNGSTWSQYGTGLSNGFVNCLFINSSAQLFAGTDAGVSILTGSAWSNVNTGITANKPVRALLANATGTMYAGLGFYVFQKGSIKGEIFYSTNNGGLWQNADGGFNSTTVSSMAISGGNLFAAANGVWKAAAANNWVYAMNGIALANNTYQMKQSQQGDWFLICRNGTGTTQGCAGVFRSSDKGVTWTSINNGINCQKTDVIFIDSYGWLWLGAKQFTGANINPSFGNPELYHSSDNGNTWIRETTIVTPNDGYQQIDEDKQGRLFVTNSFGQYQSNISSNNNHTAFANNLNPPPNNGDKSYGLAINSLGHIFHGTETIGLFRSTSNGAAGTFIPITNGVPLGPLGNVSVFIDPNNDYIFSGGTHGQMNGSIIQKTFFGSTAVDNGTNMFLFNNMPDNASIPAMAFDNRGNVYISNGAGNPTTTQGVYVGSFPWNSNTNFTRLISFGSFSYYFFDYMIDDCGYLYGMNTAGSGIYKSTLPVNTPLQSILTVPANNATGISLTPALSWTHKCIPDSFRLQIATDSLFANTIYNRANIVTTSFQLPVGILVGANKFYWRISGVNAVGAGKWSAVNNFSTTNVISCGTGNNIITTNLPGTTYQWQVNTGTGFVNITDNTNYTGSNTKTLQLTAAPASWYGYQYECLTNGIAGNTFSLKFVSYWNGAANNIWGNTLNWNCGTVPDANTDAVINSGTVSVTATAACRSLNMTPGVVFTITPGITFTVTR